MSDSEGYRPWGYYEILTEKSDHKVKRVTVEPGKRLSLQRHRRRSEHWCIISGEGLVTIDGNDTLLKTGQSIDINCGAIHRITNNTDRDVVFIEVQRGDYFGEDDIERLEDDFGRD